MSTRAKLWLVAVAALGATTVIAEVAVADRIVYQGRLVMGSRSVIVMTGAGANPVELPLPSGSDRITPALSPDGKTVAYAAKSGDAYKLWVVGLADDNTPVGEPKQVTTAAGDDEQPSWSPDGRRLAYVSGSGDERGVYVIAVDGGEPTKLAALGSDFRTACPHWTPDGSRVVFGSEGKIFIVDASGGEPKALLDDGAYASMSPDGSQMAFFRLKPKPALCVISRTGGAPRVLVQNVEFYGETAWSPDGKAIAFKADKVNGVGGSLWVVSVGGGKAKALRSYGVAHGYLDWAGPMPVAAAANRPPAALRVAKPSAPAAPAKPAASSAVAAARKPAPAPKTVAPKRPATVVAAKPPAPVDKPVSAPQKAVAPLPPVVAEKPAEAPAQPAPVRIVSPADGAVVRGITRVTASKTSPGGYATFLVDGVFVQATIAPYEMDWDTRPVGDGPHTLSVTAYNASGGLEGTAEARIEVRNAIGEEAAPQEGIALRYRFKPKEKWDYDVRVTAKAGAKGEVPLGTVAAQAGTLTALLTQRVESVKDVVLGQSGATGQARTGSTSVGPPSATSPGTAAGSTTTAGQPQTVATLISQIRSGRLDAPGSGGRLPQAGQAARSTRTLDGAVTVVAQPDIVPIALGNLSVVFPKDPIKIGDKWTAPMTILPVLRSDAVARVMAEHKADSMQWEGGFETVKIVSTFKLASLPVAVGGMSLDNVTGTRTTWFAYKEHRVVRMQDDIEGTFNQKAALAATQAAATRGYAGTTAYRSSAATSPLGTQRTALGGRGGLNIRLGGGASGRRAAAMGTTTSRTPSTTRPPLSSGGFRIGLGGGSRRAAAMGRTSSTRTTNPWQVGGQPAGATPYQPGVQAGAAATTPAQGLQLAAQPSPVVHYSLNLVSELGK